MEIFAIRWKALRFNVAAEEFLGQLWEIIAIYQSWVEFIAILYRFWEIVFIFRRSRVDQEEDRFGIWGKNHVNGGGRILVHLFVYAAETREPLYVEGALRKVLFLLQCR